MIFGLLTATDEHLIVETVDRGEAVFDRLKLNKPEAVTDALGQAREGGYGLTVIRTVMDVLHYERLASGRNVWKLERRLPVGTAR